MGKIESFYPVAGSIEETGAVAGDFVRCIKGEAGRYTTGAIYEVISHLGCPHVYSDALVNPTDKEARAGVRPYLGCYPTRGWGGKWQKVGDDD